MLLNKHSTEYILSNNFSEKIKQKKQSDKGAKQYASGTCPTNIRKRQYGTQTAQQVADGEKLVQDCGWIGKKQSPPSPLYSQIKNKASQQRNRLQTAKNWRRIVDGLEKAVPLAA